MTEQELLSERAQRVPDLLDNRRHDRDGIGYLPLAAVSNKAPLPPERVSVLMEAEGLIHGARNSDYGHPIDNHGTTADLMSAYLRRKHGVAITMDAEDVCLFNVLQKVSRLANTPGHRDSLVDIGGYVGCVEMIQDERARRA